MKNIEKVKILIANGDLNNAIGELLITVRAMDYPDYNRLILMSYKYNSIKIAEKKGVLSWNEANINKINLVDKLLILLDDILDDGVD